MAMTGVSAKDVDLSDPDFWAAPDEEREAAFAALRRERPVAFFEERPIEGIGEGPGYWALTKYDDVWHVSRHPDVFSSANGVNIVDIPVELSEFLGSMIAMDAPRHSKLRALVQRGFTPRHIARIEEHIKEVATRIVDRVEDLGECDFVTDIAAQLPLQIICEMLGIPEEHHRFVFEQTNMLLGAGDPEYATSMEELVGAAMGLYQLAMELGQARLDDPTDDITSSLMHAEVDGERLTTSEFGSFFILLVAAGNETTRNAISHGLKLLTDHPDQRDLWTADLPGVGPTAVDEIVRMATPVISFRRTVTRDVEIRGQEIKAGEKVVMFYNSANRDEDHWDDPFRFDVRRSPNDHVGFGAGGPHFCLGANLARREMQVMFEELFTRLPGIRATSEPAMLQSGFIHGIKRMSCAW